VPNGASAREAAAENRKTKSAPAIGDNAVT
jgi:hypothetical protein